MRLAGVVTRSSIADADTAPLPKPRRWSPWRAGLVIAALIAIVGAGVGAYAWNHRPLSAQTGHVTRGDVTVAYTVTATTQSPQYAATFATTGRIATLTVVPGQPVVAGQTLATLDPTPLQATLKSAQTALDAAQTAAQSAQSAYNQMQAQAQAQISNAFTTEQHALAGCHSAQTCVSQAQVAYTTAVNQARAAQSQVKQQLDAANAQLATAQGMHDAAQQALDGATLVAPHAGTVAQVSGIVGGSGGPNQTTITIVDTTTVMLVAEVTAAQAANLRPGEPVTCNLNGQTVTGAASYLIPTPQGSGVSLRYPVWLTLDTANTLIGMVLPGTVTTAAIYPVRRLGVPVVPTSAVTFAQSAAGKAHIGARAYTAALDQAKALLLALPPDQLAGYNGQVTPAVLLARAKGRWQGIPVVLGPTDGRHTEIVSGLTPGDALVVGEA